VFFVTAWSFASLIFAFMAAGDDPDQVSAFGFARLQTTDPFTYLVVGLKGYVLVADEVGGDDAADAEVAGSKAYIAFEDFAADDDAAGSSYDWVNSCEAAGNIAYSSLFPIVLAKSLAVLALYKRVDPAADVPGRRGSSSEDLPSARVGGAAPLRSARRPGSGSLLVCSSSW